MSFGKHKTTTKADPQVRTIQVDNLNRALNLPAYQPYTGQRVADFNPVQTAAQQRLLDFSQGGVGSGLLSSAANAASAAAGYRPMIVNAPSYAATLARPVDTVSYRPASLTQTGYDTATAASAGAAAQGQAAQMNRGDIREITSGPISPDQIGAYFNPYVGNVVDTTLADLERQRQIQQTINAGEARKAHAFGGTGAAVAAGLTNDTFARQSAQTAAQLRNQGWETALSAAQADAVRALQATQSNQSADLSVAQTNVGLANSMNLANLGALNQRAEFNAGQAQQIALSNQAAANAARLANADAANRLSQSNAQGYLSADTTNAGIARDLAQGDQAAANQAGQFNAQLNFNAQAANQTAAQQGAALNLQAAGVLSQLSDQQRNQLLQDIASAQSVGDAQQKLQQAMLDAGYSEYQAAQQWPIAMQQLLNSTVGLFGNPMIQSSSNTSISLPTGPLDINSLLKIPPRS